MEQDYIQSAINILTPVMESGMILAGQYAQSTGRDYITSLDMKYGLRYAARNVTGKVTGSILSSSDDEEDDEWEEVDEELEQFRRYEGDDELMNSINMAYDTWDEWVPDSPIEKILKNAIDHNNHEV